MPDGRWEDGEYEIAVEGDVGSGPVSCRFRIPEDVPARGSSVQLDCTGALMLSLQQDSKCTPPPKNSRTSGPCELLEGQFALVGGVEGTPKELTIQLTRDGTSIVSRTVSPKYQRLQPNGPDCEPVCNRAEESITVSQEPD